MKKKIIVYKTDIQLTANIVQAFSDSINKHIKGWSSDCLHINEFIENGLPAGIDAIASLGILRGTGHLLKQAAKEKIDRYYIDHAYFDAGYDGNCWLRISKNKHTINYVKEVSNFRWKKFFSNKYEIMSWKNFKQRGDNILIIPPTNAISWYFNEYDWKENILEELKKNLNEELFQKVRVRTKPNEPIVDKYGNYLGLKQNEHTQNVSLEEDLSNASIVIAYNSQVALDATLKGIPVIVDIHNSCFAVSFQLSDLSQGLDNPIFDQEPGRIKLCNWLSYCQFKLEEIKNGFAWKTINNFQI